MKLRLNPDIIYETLEKHLEQKFPQYSISRLKNPIAGFEYVEVKKSAAVGVWIRIFEKKNKVVLTGCMPSAIARITLGPLLIIVFMIAQNKLCKEIGTAIMQKFNTVTM